MRFARLTILAVLCGHAGADDSPTFAAYHILTSEENVGAYQISLECSNAQFVGVESGGQSFPEAPYYDPETLAKNEVLTLAAINKEGIPNSDHLLAVVHVMEQANNHCSAKLQAAANITGERITAPITVVQP